MYRKSERHASPRRKVCMTKRCRKFPKGPRPLGAYSAPLRPGPAAVCAQCDVPSHERASFPTSLRGSLVTTRRPTCHCLLARLIAAVVAFRVPRFPTSLPPQICGHKKSPKGASKEPSMLIGPVWSLIPLFSCLRFVLTLRFPELETMKKSQKESARINPCRLAHGWALAIHDTTQQRWSLHHEGRRERTQCSPKFPKSPNGI